jgi:hypothetical protein
MHVSAMSALGQKQTSDSRLVMSAIPPKAALPGDGSMSALCHKQTFHRFCSIALSSNRASHGFTSNPKAYSISQLAMHLMLSCRAVTRIAAQSYKPTFSM